MLGYGRGEGRSPEQGEVGERHGQRLDGGGVEKESTPVKANAEIARIHVRLRLGENHVLVRQGDVGDRDSWALDPVDGLWVRS